MRKLLRYLGIFLCWPLGIALHGWAAAVLYYCSFPSSSALRTGGASLYAAAVVLIVAFGRKKTKALLVSLIGFFLIAVWFGSIKPGKNGVYPLELSMPHAEFNGDLVTLYNVRNCDYRTKDDFDARYETRTYDLNKIRTLDMLLNYWGSPFIAHTFLSYGFSDGRYLCVSIEIRPEVGKTYGELKGLFKQYELIYIWADERDLIRLRTNYKKEDVYLYRVRFTPDKVRKLFVTMLDSTNTIYKNPVFYNTCIHSCTNTIGDNINKSGIYKVPLWKRRLLTGTVDKRMYNEGWLDTSRPFDQLRREALINKRAQDADKDKDFSAKIRTHL